MNETAARLLHIHHDGPEGVNEFCLQPSLQYKDVNMNLSRMNLSRGEGEREREREMVREEEINEVDHERSEVGYCLMNSLLLSGQDRVCCDENRNW